MTGFTTSILDALKPFLRSSGYRKSGVLFSRDLGSVIHMIQLQGSRDNSTAQASHTVNIAVLVPTLIPTDVRDARKISIGHAQWRQRLGSLCPESKDMWWTSSTLTQARANADDIVLRLRQYAFPALSELAEADALVAVWRSGRSPGLTETQRKNLIQALAL